MQIIFIHIFNGSKIPFKFAYEITKYLSCSEQIAHKIAYCTINAVTKYNWIGWKKRYASYSNNSDKLT